MDAAYAKSQFRCAELPHRYGPNVHLVDDPLAWTWLARACAQETRQPEVGRLVRRLYEMLAQQVIAAEFPRETIAVPTRMIGAHPEAVYRGAAVARGTRAVTVGIARAGTMPSQVVYEMLNEVLDPSLVRQDHLFMSRQTNEHGEVVGVVWHDAKIGRDVDGRIVLIPDPMGATGSSMSSALEHYQSRLDGKPARCIAVNLVVTPEYIKRIVTDHPNAVIYALRLDRGLSEPALLATQPGTRWEKERGLNDHQYIVPGAGGVGEILNNAWV